MSAKNSTGTYPALARAFGNPANVSEWRRRAERLRALARATRQEQQRGELLQLAEQWDGMAAQAEAYARRGYLPSGDRSAIPSSWRSHGDRA